ncbi:MAG: hypothetical protein ACFFC7_27970 [Candidatus Hermodarchaeota archaeon]
MFTKYTLPDDLQLDLILKKTIIDAGEECSAIVILRNNSTIPIEYPLWAFNHESSWFLVEGRAVYLGPLDLETEADVINKSQEKHVNVQLGRVFSALGAGKFNVSLAFFSRSKRRHFMANDFYIESPKREIEIRTTPNWENTIEGIIAGINNPDPAKRELAWKKYKLPKNRITIQRPWERSFQEVINREFSGKKLILEIKQFDQEIRREEYIVTVEGLKGKFQWKWDEVDIHGGTSCVITDKDVRSFFRSLSHGVPFDHTPVQFYGGAYEPQVVVMLRVYGEDDQLVVNCESAKMWLSELEHHYSLSKWFLRLKEWKKRRRSVKKKEHNKGAKKGE